MQDPPPRRLQPRARRAACGAQVPQRAAPLLVQRVQTQRRPRPPQARRQRARVVVSGCVSALDFGHDRRPERPPEDPRRRPRPHRALPLRPAPPARPPFGPAPLRRGRRYGRQRGHGAALRAHGHTSLRGRPEPAVPGPVSRGGRGDARGGRRGEFDDAQRTDLLGAYWRWHIDAVERGAKGDRRVCARCVLRERDEE